MELISPKTGALVTEIQKAIEVLSISYQIKPQDRKFVNNTYNNYICL